MSTNPPQMPPELRVSYNIQKKGTPFPFYITPPPFPFAIKATELTCNNGDAIQNLTLIFTKDRKEAGRATFKDGKAVIDSITGNIVSRGQKSQLILETSVDFPTMIGGEMAIKIAKPD